MTSIAVVNEEQGLISPEGRDRQMGPQAIPRETIAYIGSLSKGKMTLTCYLELSVLVQWQVKHRASTHCKAASHENHLTYTTACRPYETDSTTKMQHHHHRHHHHKIFVVHLLHNGPSVLWHCWLGLGTRPIKLSPKWPIMCLVGH